ncbi:hypothetical protein ABT340_34650 [Streptosporangium sp. NPDC000239]|uniref:hypothetical protein n=1 Tax=Streptosporangium sp. NPDC000239 TaxID=3154248 RepID=UPI0033175526
MLTVLGKERLKDNKTDITGYRYVFVTKRMEPNSQDRRLISSALNVPEAGACAGL